MKKVFNNLEEMKKYYDEGKNTYVFKEGGEHIEEVIFTFDIKVDANIDALNIKAFNLETMNINALNIPLVYLYSQFYSFIVKRVI